MNINAFIAEFIGNYREGYCMDMDGEDIQDMLAKHGLIIERLATEEECAEAWGQDIDLEPGDTVYVDSPELAAIRKAEA